MKVKELIEKLKAVNPDADVYIAESANDPLKAGYLMYADEEGDAGELEFHDGNWGMTGELAVLINEED